MQGRLIVTEGRGYPLVSKLLDYWAKCCLLPILWCSQSVDHPQEDLTKLVGTCDGRTQFARAYLFFFLHLDGLKTPIYTQTIVKWVARINGGIQRKVKEPQPKPPLYPSPQTHPPKNLKIWSLIPFWFLPRKPCVVVSTSTIISNFRSHASPIRSRDSLLLLLPCCCIWLSGPGF
jgi:hypothetical protein